MDCLSSDDIVNFHIHKPNRVVKKTSIKRCKDEICEDIIKCQKTAKK